MRIILHSYQLGDRGTEVCLYKYAKWLREYGHDILICSTSSRPTPTLSRFNYFPVYLYPYVWQNDGVNKELVDYFNKFDVDLFYALKGGENDGILNLNCKTAAHCIFRMDQPHGSVYAGVCEYISKKHGAIYPWVDHIVDYPKVSGMRSELGIPKDAMVGFRHGGYDTFNLDFVQRAVIDSLKREDLWYIFLNTRPFINHERVIYLDWSGDQDHILRFVNTGDFFIHGRFDGEIFPLTCAEASTQNKPLVTWNPQNPPAHYDTGHISLFGDRAFYYTDTSSLLNFLLGVSKKDLQGDWDIYKDKYSGPNVIEQFEKVFL